ncbi:DUF418 domain-containing protein [Natranaerobius trueperi]|uniref:DUF418 domain-containing protein n=1 Tax=Natranaerobius trueperi TaxID=759412 RepID=A0A226BV56_9FIRM|nr:hypothetical protein [Natranaerobius trueperi]OWZ82761.1 hypothetical protein CDO51_12320 [Natranaerobius trueperi]
MVKPTKDIDRIKVIDSIRGFSLLGVLLVNVVAFNNIIFAQTDPISFLAFPPSYPNLIDQILAFLIRIHAEGKFYPIFSLLFGVGFFIFMERAHQKKTSGTTLFKRRSLYLFLFGLINLTLVWYGDILHVYELGGFLLLPFLNKDAKTLFKWIVFLLIIFIVLTTTFSFLTELASKTNEPFSPELVEKAQIVYTEGSYISLVSFRVTNELPTIFLNLIIWIPKILAFFLIGLYLAKNKLFQNVKENYNLIKKIWKITGLIGILSTIIMTISSFELIISSSLLAVLLKLSLVNYHQYFFQYFI